MATTMREFMVAIELETMSVFNVLFDDGRLLLEGHQLHSHTRQGGGGQDWRSWLGESGTGQSWNDTVQLYDSSNGTQVQYTPLQDRFTSVYWNTPVLQYASNTYDFTRDGGHFQLHTIVWNTSTSDSMIGCCSYRENAARRGETKFGRWLGVGCWCHFEKQNAKKSKTRNAIHSKRILSFLVAQNHGKKFQLFGTIFLTFMSLLHAYPLRVAHWHR